MESVTSSTLWSTVAALPDYLLLAQTRQLARHEQALQILVLDHLREIEARRLHLTRGYGSLFDYVVHELGYTAAAAWRRIKAMRLCSGTNGARELLQDGSLNLSNAAQLQNLFERSDRSRGRPPAIPGTGDGLAPVAPMRPDGGDPAPAAGPVLDAATREELVKQASGKSTREVMQMVAEIDPELAQPSDRMRALGAGRWELKATIDAECRHGLEKLQMLLSHQDPHLTLGGLVARLVREGLERYDPARPPRARRTGGCSVVGGGQSATEPVRRDAEADQRSAVRAKGNDVERRGDVGRGDASLAVDQVAASRSSEPRQQTQTECINTKSAPVSADGGCTDSAAKHHSGAEHDSTSPAAAPNRVGLTTSPAKRKSHAQVGPTSQAATWDGDGRTTSAPNRYTEAERGGANSWAVKPSAHDDVACVEEAEGLRGVTGSASGRHCEAEHSYGQPKAMHGNGELAASLAKRQAQAASDTGDAEVGGVLDRAARATGPQIEADRRNPSRAPARGGRLFPTSAAKLLAYAAGHGAAERSAAVERHLAALSSFGALPGSRSRHIPAAVRREVWRRDQGRCTYVDRHSGRRCGSRYRLEIDHIMPFALGGATELSNVRLRCRAHHKLRHAHSESVPTEARRGPESAVDPLEHGRTVASHAAIDRPGYDSAIVEACAPDCR